MYRAEVYAPGYGVLKKSEHKSATSAWKYLAEERRKEEEEKPVYQTYDEKHGFVGGYEFSGTVAALEYIASGDHEFGNTLEDQPTNADGTGEVWGTTPGDAEDHDESGIAYRVVYVG